MKIIKNLNPLIIFDYIYYRIAYFYSHRFDYDESKEFSGKAILSLFQLFNIVVILNPKKYFNNNGILIIFFICYFVIVTLNHIRYKKIITYDKLALKWDKERRMVRWIKSALIICYFIGTSVLLGI
jgi:hypothetical protein